MGKARPARTGTWPPWRSSIASGVRGGLLGLLFVLPAFLSVPAYGVVPHVPATPDTDACAMCHRTHSAASSIRYRDADSGEFVDSALIVGTADTDVELCYVCHGVANLGSQADVQTDFEKTSAHALTPEGSAYGPSPKGCSDCHDSHGTARTEAGDPYPALLRAYNESRDATVTSGDEYCATCHTGRAEDRWDGLEVWRSSAHAALPEPASGTRIRCSNCHVSHGSSIAPLVAETLLPPSVAATTAVEGNDRRLCLTCHPDDEGDTWRGEALYAASSHASSTATTVIDGEWAEIGAGRKVGECQTCHAPMGRSDGSGGVIPKLVDKAGRALCDGCHDADGPAGSDLASLVPTPGAGAYAELAVTFRPGAAAGSYGRLSVFSQEPTSGEVRVLTGPREFGARDAASSPAGPSTGHGAAAFGGDTQGDGLPDVVVADPGVPRLRFYSPDPLVGLAQRVRSLPSGRPPAEFVAVGDFLLDAGGSLEIAVVSSADTTDAAQAYLYRERIQSGTTVLDEVAGPLDVGRGVTGVARGDVLSGGADELVVTAGADDAFYVLRDDGGTWTAGGPYAAGGALPRGPSTGDAWPGGTEDEIVLLRGSGPGEVAVFGGNGSFKGSADLADYGAEATATATLVADVLPGIDRAEVVVAVDAGAGTSGIEVVPQDSGGLDGAAAQSYQTGAGYRSSSLAAGHLDGDGALELVVGNSGWREAGEANWVGASVQVLHSNEDGTALEGVQLLWAGGTELAGGPPSMVVADLGALGGSRHPVGVAEGAHDSTESGASGALVRHVECVDCHNVHEAVSSPAAEDATAPDAYGRLKGAWGVEVDNQAPGVVELAERRGVLYEYELCLKCHSSWSALGGGRDVASELATTNPSFHGVEDAPGASMPSGAFVDATPAWTGDSRMYCVDCHADSDPGRPAGPHVSDEAPLLRAPYLGTPPADAELLCYTCHVQGTYEAGGVPVTDTDFRDAEFGGRNLHVLHSGDKGLGCASCHVGHGSQGSIRLMRDDVGFEKVGGTGTCDGACHAGDSQAYMH
ncbi:MAG: hypothetical protein IBX62_07335 [Coriobacteriia bacterium]|nr:hypothetical protein [Coriobacteriia bacterium]